MKFSSTLLAISILALVKVPVGGGCGGSSRAHHPHPAETGSAKTTNAPAAKLAPGVPAAGPDIQIRSPLRNEILDSNDVGIFVTVRDLPTQQGAHLHVTLDNQPPMELPDPQMPAVFRNLAPGWHVARVFACDATHVSFKNHTALATAVFRVTAATGEPAFNPELPTLTLNLPSTSYRKLAGHGVPVDFLVSGVAAGGWRVRLSVDGEQKEEFTYADSKYRLPLEPGEHVVRVELLDTKGNPITANFGTTQRAVRVR